MSEFRLTEADYCDERALGWALIGDMRTATWLHALGAMIRGIEAGDSLLEESYEAAKSCRREPEIMRWLAATTKVHEGLLTANFVGVIRACVFTDGTWQPEPTPAGVKAGVAAITIPVFGGARSCGTARGIDIVALDPAWWGRRTAFASVLAPNVEEFDLRGWPEGRRIRLYRSPLGWLKGGFAPFGYCVLDWESAEARGPAFSHRSRRSRGGFR